MLKSTTTSNTARQIRIAKVSTHFSFKAPKDRKLTLKFDPQAAAMPIKNVIAQAIETPIRVQLATLNALPRNIRR